MAMYEVWTIDRVQYLCKVLEFIKILNYFTGWEDRDDHGEPQAIQNPWLVP